MENRGRFSLGDSGARRVLDPQRIVAVAEDKVLRGVGNADECVEHACLLEPVLRLNTESHRERLRWQGVILGAIPHAELYVLSHAAADAVQDQEWNWRGHGIGLVDAGPAPEAPVEADYLERGAGRIERRLLAVSHIQSRSPKDAGMSNCSSTMFCGGRGCRVRCAAAASDKPITVTTKRWGSHGPLRAFS